MTVVLDANVYIGASLGKGSSSEIVKLWKYGKIDVANSQATITEIQKALLYPSVVSKRPTSNRKVKSFFSFIRRRSTMVEPQERLQIVDDEPDNRYVECCIASEASILISYDKGMKQAHGYKGIVVTTPKYFLAFYANLSQQRTP